VVTDSDAKRIPGAGAIQVLTANSLVTGADREQNARGHLFPGGFTALNFQMDGKQITGEKSSRPN